MEPRADIAVIGLAVMGQNLILNMNDHGYTVAAYNRTVSKVDDFINGAAKGTNIIGAKTLDETISLCKLPRRIMLMVKAGTAVDEFIHMLIPKLDKGDIIIDGGNSHFADTERRVKECGEQGILFVGTGVSGGEEGARRGPSIMPGGNEAAWPHIKDVFQAIAAKTDDGNPCCEWVGSGGAGHYVKMVHNGIEYGDMQLIAEAYHLMKDGLGIETVAMADIFKDWNRSELGSYLIEITADILAFLEEDGTPLVEKILDSTEQKGTGKWTGQSSLDLGVPITLISEAVYARCISALKDERMKAASVLHGPAMSFTSDKLLFIRNIRDALLAAKIVSYAQGFMLLREAAHQFGWKLNYGAIAVMWQGGCIIRSVFLGKIKDAFVRDENLFNLLLDNYFSGIVNSSQGAWRVVVSQAIAWGIPVPCMSSALAFFDGYRTKRLPANLLQAQRDYFGAHTYERVDRQRGEYFHTNWTGRGGDAKAGRYEI